MHGPAFHQLTPGSPPRLWLIAGTGEGPPLAAALLERGWRLRVSVVSEAATGAYDRHPHLELVAGAIAGDGGVAEILARAAAAGQPFRWLLDASHPFASEISASLARVCGAMAQPLLRLERPRLGGPGVRSIADLDGLRGQCRAGERVLLAIGGRHLAAAVACLPGALLHCRILPGAPALRQAMAAGLAPDRVACLRPGVDGASDPLIERALCRQWGIETVICRGSGAAPQIHWQRICAELGLRLLLLERPALPARVEGFSYEALLERVGTPASEAPQAGGGRLSPGAAPPAPAGTLADGGRAG
jgi:precorrin-6A/cobalt-precorrin-6A reductase